MNEPKKPNKAQTTTIDKIIKEFDFQRVHDVMKLINWKWIDTEAVAYVPHIYQLEETARRLLEEMVKSTKEYDIIATGGFEAVKWDNALVLNFVLTGWDEELEGNKNSEEEDKEAKEVKEEETARRQRTPFDDLKI